MLHLQFQGLRSADLCLTQQPNAVLIPLYLSVLQHKLTMYPLQWLQIIQVMAVPPIVKTQASCTVPAEEWKISHDHNYSMSVPMVYPTYGLGEDSLTPNTKLKLTPFLKTLTLT